MITKSNTNEINFCALFTYKSVHIKTFQLQRLLYTCLYKNKFAGFLASPPNKPLPQFAVIHQIFFFCTAFNCHNIASLKSLRSDMMLCDAR